VIGGRFAELVGPKSASAVDWGLENVPEHCFHLSPASARGYGGRSAFEATPKSVRERAARRLSSR